MLHPGDTYGRYTIVRKLGEGGMGLVYEARNHFGAAVVLKMLHPELAGNADVRERFRREGQIQYQLRHPNIVRVTDILEENEVPALVVDFMKGRDLERELATVGVLPLPEVVSISVKMLDALAAAHEKGFVHRDIKPANIFLEETDAGVEPRLMDFGIAKIEATRGLTQVRDFVGTPNFSSPEQIQSTRDADSRADIYSYGMVIWQMLSGSEPYADLKDPVQVMLAVVRQPVPALPDGTPDWLRTIVARATEKDPARRYQTAAEMRDALAAHAGVKAAPSIASRPAPLPVGERVDDTMPTLATVAPDMELKLDFTGAPAAVGAQKGRAMTQLPGELQFPAQAQGERVAVPPSAAAPSSERARPMGLSGSAAVVPQAGHQTLTSSGSRPAVRSAAPLEAELSRGEASRAAARPAGARASSSVPATRAPSPRSDSAGGSLALRVGGALVVLAAAGAAALFFAKQGGPTEASPAGWVRVEPGTFVMGSLSTEPAHGDKEQAHNVTITYPFLVSAYEVTQKEWEEITYRKPTAFTGCGPTCPVTDVSWFDAVAFANRLSERSKLESCYEIKESGTAKEVGWPRGTACRGFRLPTEAEWEYAARAGGAEALGDAPLTALERQPADPALAERAVFGGNSAVTYAGAEDCSKWGDGLTTCGVAPVGSKKANRWGLFDVSGNASEWVWDTLSNFPINGVVDPAQHASGQPNLVRGGSWMSAGRDCRLAAREQTQPVARKSFGIRLVRSIDP
ncbi:MAG: SUMF1/EgtB/PvdO family nonheme iron enzyme [Deltaproteobacteria bacterium]|nr:SUMF1/EgtB/PvdO family nonheme iron enzyme [Deltaproteobacteria bacterium]